MSLPTTMAAVQLIGHGGLDQLVYREDVPVPTPGPGEVILRVLAAGVNNTDINTRIGWYSKSVVGATGAGGADGLGEGVEADGSWSGEPLGFPRIQGADCYGEIVAVGEGVSPARLGERALVRTMLRAPVDFAPYRCWTFGSDCDGGFAEYARAPAADVFTVQSDLDAAALGAIPCAYGTAEGMLQRAGVAEGERVLITGASGGVGAAAVQLARLRGAEVIAVASKAKAPAVEALGAARVLDRGADILKALGSRSVDVVVDLVGGPGFSALPEILGRGGRYVTAGAIAGPEAAFDLRTLYLNDLRAFLAYSGSYPQAVK